VIQIADSQSNEEAEAQRTFRTYVHYLSALRILLGALEELKIKQRSLPDFAALTPRSIPIKTVERALHRGWLNLKAMRVVPLKQYPEMALAANLWAPVQAYYAIHDVGSAVLATLQGDHPQTHNGFLRVATSCFGNLLPHPFSVTCAGYSDISGKNKIVLTGTSVTQIDSREISVLSAPNPDDAEALFIKALTTTHDRRFDEDCRKLRKQKGVKRLTRDEKLRRAWRLSPTSVFHFLYRLRLRSNYEDPRMFLAGQSNVDFAVQHYIRLYDIAQTILILLQEVALRAIHRNDASTLRERYSQFSKTPEPPWPSSA
jgi:hypothetical protein